MRISIALASVLVLSVAANAQSRNSACSGDDTSPKCMAESGAKSRTGPAASGRRMRVARTRPAWSRHYGYYGPPRVYYSPHCPEGITNGLLGACPLCYPLFAAVQPDQCYGQ
jgi:hypothetical protein